MEHYESAEQFIARLDAGEFDGRLLEEIRKLPCHRLLQVANFIADRQRTEARLRGQKYTSSSQAEAARPEGLQ